MMRSKNGQSKIEYAQLWIFIFIAFLMMGPYVARGISALFKALEDQTQDSYNDPLLQAPKDSIPADSYNIPIINATH